MIFRAWSWRKHTSFVRMPVVYVRIVSVRVNELLVTMAMRVRSGIGHRRIARNMDVLMMLVVHMRMIMFHHLVPVLVLVRLANV